MYSKSYIINCKSELLIQYFIAVEVINQGFTPTFGSRVRSKMTDLTISTEYMEYTEDQNMCAGLVKERYVSKV